MASVVKILTYAVWENNSGSIRLWESLTTCDSLYNLLSGTSFKVFCDLKWFIQDVHVGANSPQMILFTLLFFSHIYFYCIHFVVLWNCCCFCWEYAIVQVCHRHVWCSWPWCLVFIGTDSGSAINLLVTEACQRTSDWADISTQFCRHSSKSAMRPFG